MSHNPESHPGWEKGLIAAGAVATVGAAALAAANVWCVLSRRNEFTLGQREELTRPSSILEYYALAYNEAEKLGLELYAAGGIVKQALGDRQTEIDPENRTIRVSSSAECDTRKKATVLRPKEWTIRDLDFRLKRYGDEETGEWVLATPNHEEYIKEKAAKLQKTIDKHADKHDLEFGPELSLFGYEPEFDHPFSPLDYASKTAINKEGNKETIFDNNGHRHELAVNNPWIFIIELRDGTELRMLTDSPEDILGRTMNRTIVNRKRDLRDVNRIIKVLEARGLWEKLHTKNWHTYRTFRKEMDSQTTLASINSELRASQTHTALALGIIKVSSPLVHAAESLPLAAELRRRGSRLWKFANQIMGATPTEQETGVKDDASVTSER